MSESADFGGKLPELMQKGLDWWHGARPAGCPVPCQLSAGDLESN